MSSRACDLIGRLEEKHVTRAQRLNALLHLLPRYYTDRRWNAKVANAIVLGLQSVFPSRLFHDCRVFSRSIAAGERSVGLRFLLPDGAPRGVYVHFHGGAWVLGNARLDDGITSRVAKECQLIAVAVDFRNALDDRVDLAIDDCEIALNWVVRNLSDLGVGRIVLGGESSGAHLAAQALLRLRDRGMVEAFWGFISTCGAFDFKGSRSLRSANSASLIVDAPAALRNLQRLRSSLPWNERDGPLHAQLEGLPPALFIAGELDPIVDDSIQMFRTWQDANGNASLSIVPAGPHGFNRLPTAIAKITNAYAREWLIDRCSGLH
ncbi:alpha/beta hydrolase [Rhizobium leguminosarum]|jgi:acetyl esterase/lipase|uniref:alpha/beta hydrolase n=1 Tax=Rhizobium leguminosarum TaxID=384 RepID=UPI000FEC2976|nr:alpha/beta hydrolase fold domain-containing protein [Rhizobium leguminosarum]MBY2943929.1 alpha/beta hydrolase [Rhizobium leguminosarum]RWX29076.1 alpha/beta hydrolase [Rhizobium leguminosarum]